MSLAARVRNSFVAGLVLVAPLAVTAFVLHFALVRVARVLDPVVKATRLTRYTAESDLIAQVLAAVLIIASLTLLGYVA
jgi:uncharacterized membrane protein